MDCKFHKEYKALRKPRAKCWMCWLMFLENNPNMAIMASDLLDMILSFDETVKDIGLVGEDLDTINSILKDSGLIK